MLQHCYEAKKAPSKIKRLQILFYFYDICTLVIVLVILVMMLVVSIQGLLISYNYSCKIRRASTLSKFVFY